MNPSRWNPKVSPITAIAVIVSLFFMGNPAQIAMAFASPSGLKFLALVVAGYALYRGPIFWIWTKVRSVKPHSYPDPAEAVDSESVPKGVRAA